MKRIGLFLPNWIGDVVMATPAIRAVREKYPQARLVAVCRSYVADLLGGSPWFDDLILHDKKGPPKRRSWAVIQKLRRERLDAAILFPNSFRSALFAALGGAKRRIGFIRYARGFMLTDGLKPIRDAHGKIQPSPIIDDYNRLAMPLGVDPPSRQMELFTTRQDDEQAKQVWEKLGLTRYPEVIGINSSGAFGAAKLWPSDSFALLIQQLVDRRGSGILVVCGPNERDLAREIVRKAGRPGVVSLAEERVSIGLSKACIRQMDLLVTTDSGPRHFAAAFNRPVLSLFGPTFIEWTETYFEKAINLQKKVPCGPCQQRVCPLDHRCMKEITVGEVFQAASDLLHRFPPTAKVRHAG